MEAFRINPHTPYAIGSGHAELGSDYGVSQHHAEVVRVVAAGPYASGPDIVASTNNRNRWRLDPAGRMVALLDPQLRQDDRMPQIVPLGHVLGPWAAHEAAKQQRIDRQKQDQLAEDQRRSDNLAANQRMLEELTRTLSSHPDLHIEVCKRYWNDGYIQISRTPTSRPLKEDEAQKVLECTDTADLSIEMSAELMLDLSGALVMRA